MSQELRCTYRLQLHAGFDFAEAAALAPYLAELGVSHVYASPYLQAAKGSTHGYDVVDHHTVNAELGGEPGRRALVAALKTHGLGQVLDIVPNHMAITSDNPWWRDVLENGPSSRYAACFDVDWDPPESRLRNTLLLPVLGDHYGRIVEAGEIKLAREGGRFVFRYFDNTFPVAPRSLDKLVRAAAATLRGQISATLAFIGDALGDLPLATATDRESVHRRHRDKEVLRAELERLISEHPEVGQAVDREIQTLNASPDALDELLERQNYRLAFWRAAGRDLGYRRFFDINTLVGLRMEDERVFKASHELILAWLADGALDGVRIDHPDGLRDPKEYCERLRAAAPNAWIVVEKILEEGEELRADWPVDGTTGYEFLNHLGGLFVDPAAKAPLTAFYRELTGEHESYDERVRAKKHLVLRDLLGSDLNRLTALFVEVCERHRRHRDYTRHELHEALAEYVACLGVYRTYVRPGEAPHAEDARRIGEATERAKAHRPDVDPRLFDFLSNILLGREAGALEAEMLRRVQQFTGSVMAKGVEDTVFYGFTRFAALNEVGGNPDQFGTSPAAFHAHARQMADAKSSAMLASSTHDTKRSEDVRARLYVLSEMTDAWTDAVRRWRELNAKHEPPAPEDELLYYQSLVGAWPIDAERMRAYMQKACREAKTHTAWLAVNEAYEKKVAAFIDRTLGDRAFVRDLERFVEPLVEKGRVTSLAQTLVKLTHPGIPDIYRGCELWDLSLVDPDNRRPVDFGQRRQLLRELRGATVEQVLAAADAGLPKLLVTHRALQLRQKRPELYAPGASYEPLATRGAKAEHAVAFVRGGAAVTIVPRLVHGLGGDWRDTTVTLPPGRWINVLTTDAVAGGEQRLAALLGRFPVALLVKGAD